MTNPTMKGAIGYEGTTHSRHPMKIKKPNSSPENEVGLLLNLACLAATGSPLPSDYFTQDWKYVDIVDGSGNKETRHALYKSSSKPALYADPFRYASVNGLEQQIKRHLITDEIKTTFQRTPINPMWFILDILIDDIKRSTIHKRKGTIKEFELAMRSDLGIWCNHANAPPHPDFDELSPIPNYIRLDIKDAYKKIKEHLPKFRLFEASILTSADRLVLQKEYQSLDKIVRGRVPPNQGGGVLWTPLFAILNFCELSTTKDAVINAAKNLKVWRSKVKIRSIIDRKKGGPCNICRKERKVVAINTWSFPSCWFGQCDPLPLEKGDFTAHVFPGETSFSRSWNDARDCLTNSGYVKTGKKFWVPHFWMKMRDESEDDKNYRVDNRTDQTGYVLGLEWDRRNKRKVWNYVKDCSSTPNDFVNHNPKGWEDRFANNLISCY